MVVPGTSPAGKGSLWMGALPLLVLPALVIALQNEMAAWLFMWALSFAIFAGLKWMTWWKARRRIAHSAGRSLAYLVAWPGMDAESCLDARKRPHKPNRQEWVWTTLKTALGVALLWIVARRIPEEQGLLRGWMGLSV